MAHRAHVVAHRGFHVHEPENSLAAVRAAAGAGATMVEIDANETLDGELVVCHDTHVDGLAISALPADEVRRRLPSAPSLRDVLAAAALPLDVEIKQSSPARVVEELRRGAPHGTLVTSFAAASVTGVKALAPELACGLLVTGPRLAALGDSPLAAELLEAARAAHADFLALETALARGPVLETLAAELAPSFVWVVNDPGQLERLRSDPAVAGVVTDRPDLLQG